MTDMSTPRTAEADEYDRIAKTVEIMLRAREDDDLSISPILGR